jgi:hypothetical protein
LETLKSQKLNGGPDIFIKTTEKKMVNGCEIVYTDSPINLVHRTHNSQLSIKDINPLRIGTKQWKNKREFVGFYNYDVNQGSKRSDEELDERYGSNKIFYTIPAGSKILDCTGRRGSTSRIRLKDAQELIDAGFVAIKGYDYLGPPEFVVLQLFLSDKEGATGVNKQDIKTESYIREFVRHIILEDAEILYERRLLREGIGDYLNQKFLEFSNMASDLVVKSISKIINSITKILSKIKEKNSDKKHEIQKIQNHLTLYANNKKYAIAAASSLAAILSVIGQAWAKSKGIEGVDDILDFIKEFFLSKREENSSSKDEYQKDLNASMVANRDPDELKSKRARSAQARAVRRARSSGTSES